MLHYGLFYFVVASYHVINTMKTLQHPRAHIQVHKFVFCLDAPQNTKDNSLVIFLIYVTFLDKK